MASEMDAGSSEVAPQPSENGERFDPVAIVDLCEKAKVPSLITPLLRIRASVNAAQARVYDAPDIMRTCDKLGFPELGPVFLAAGMDIEAVRASLNEMKVLAEGRAPTDTALMQRDPGTSYAKRPQDIDTEAVYAKHNAPNGARR